MTSVEVHDEVKEDVAGTEAKPQEKLRIREELLPDSAKYITLDDREYVMIPVDEFGEWYEDIVDGAVSQDRLLNDTGNSVTLEELEEELRRERQGDDNGVFGH